MFCYWYILINTRLQVTTILKHRPSSYPYVPSISTVNKNATSFYLPALVCLNIIHLFLTYKRGLSTYLNDAQQGGSQHTSDKKLAGGAWLDLLFVIILSQFGSLFVHEGFMDSMLIVLPALHGLKNRFWCNSPNPPLPAPI